MTNLVGLREALQNLVSAVEKADNMIDEGLSANHPAMEAARSALEQPAQSTELQSGIVSDGPVGTLRTSFPWMTEPGVNRDEPLAAEINALPERVRRWIHILESDPAAGDKWRLLEAQQNIAGLTAEIERLRNDGVPTLVISDTLRPELSADSPDGQYAAVLKEAEKGEPVNTVDLINALWWRLRNQRREIAKLHAQRKDTEHPPTAPQRGTLEPTAKATGEGADTEVSENS